MKYLLLIFISFIFLGCDSIYQDEKMTNSFHKKTDFIYLTNFSIKENEYFSTIHLTTKAFPSFFQKPKECDKFLEYRTTPFPDLFFSRNDILTYGKEEMFKYALTCSEAINKSVEEQFSKEIKAIKILKTPFKD